MQLIMPPIPIDMAAKRRPDNFAAKTRLSLYEKTALTG